MKHDLLHKTIRAVSLFLLMFATFVSADAFRLQTDLMTGEFYFNMPKSGEHSLSIDGAVKSFKLYDDGGKDGNYSYSKDSPLEGLLQLVAPEGYLFKLSGTMDFYGSLNIYDGGSDATELYRTGLFYITKSLELESSGNVLTLGYALYRPSYVDEYVSGFDFAVSLVNTNVEYTITCATGIVDGSITCPENNKAKYGNVVSLKTTPESGFLLAGVEVKDENQKVVNVERGQWYSDNTVSFKMPESNVTVTPVFTNDFSDLYINVPATGTVDAVIPPGVTSFMIYDEGGKDMASDRYNKGSLRIFTTDDALFDMEVTKFVFQEDKNVWRFGSQHLCVCEGVDCDCDGGNVRMFDLYSMYSTVSIAGHRYSKGNVLTVLPSMEPDFEIRTNIVKKDAEHTITCATGIVGGSITCPENNKAKYGDVVTLKTTPESGYLLAGIEVKGENHEVVEVEGGQWYSNNTASFKMPGANVTVTPVFTNDLSNLYINMPANDGTVEAVVPPEVTAFKLYDYGGKENSCAPFFNFWQNRSFDPDYTGTLLLNVQEGNIVQVTGSTKFYNLYYENLSISSSLKSFYSNNTAENGVTENVLYLSSDNALRFYLNTNNDSEGLDFKVLVGKKKEHRIMCATGVDGGSLVCPETDVESGEVVSLTAVPQEGYVLTGVEIRDVDNNLVSLVDGLWGENNMVSFQMPLLDVTVTPIFTNNLSNFQVCMRRSGTERTVVIPLGVTSFKVYDNGGKDGDYSGFASYYDENLILIAPEGYFLKLTGDMDLSSSISGMSSGLMICDGRSCENGDAKLMDKQTGVKNDISLRSSSNALRLSSFSKSYHGYFGFDFTVDVIKNEPHKVECLTSGSGGSMECPKDKVPHTETVTLTAIPDNNVLLGVEVIAADNSALNVTGGTWYNNTVSFQMPFSDVTVKPTFGMPTNLFVNMPKTGILDVNIPLSVESFKVFDDGGAIGNYGDGVNGTIRLLAPNDNYVIQVTGSINTDENDKLSICDAVTCEGNVKKLTDNVSGSINDISVLSSGKILAIKFTSNSKDNAEGINLKVNVIKKEKHTITCNSVEGGSIRCPANNKINAGKKITLNERPNNGYVLTGYYVQDKNGNVLESTSFPWYSENKEISVTMPFTDIIVTPTFESVANLYINMPTSGTLTISNVPAGLTSFHVYDDGGGAGDYSESMNSTLKLNVPDGKLFVVSGSVHASGADELKFIDDEGKYASFTGETDDVSFATANSMNISFAANSASSMAGIDLEVNIVENVENAIACGSAEGGELTCSKDKAKAGDLVKLTASPAEGYVLSGIEVRGADGNAVKVEGGKWYSNNTASFKMPLDGVTVTPVFAEAKDLYINMPTNGDNPTVYVPAGVLSFKVYDDGGKDGPYSKNKSGEIYLSVPDDYMILITGSLEADEDVYLEVGDNATSIEKSRVASAEIDIRLDGKRNPFIYFSASGGAVTDAAAGIDLTVNLVKKTDYAFRLLCADAVEGGSIICPENYTAKGGDPIDLTVAPEGDYVLLGVEIEGMEESSAMMGDIGFSDNKISFSMPFSDVSLKPLFADKTTEFFVNMPKSGTKKLVVATDITELKVYDDGGKENFYSNSVNGSLLLTVPKGYFFELSGTAETESGYDYLTIFDGEYGANPMLSTSGTIDLNKRSLISTSNVVTILLESDDIVTRSGLDIKVSILKKQEHTIACGHAEGGTLACSRDKANTGKKVRLKATTEDGYVFVGADVKTANGNVVNVTSDGNTAWFYTPYSDVTVTPIFMNISDFFINMPATGGYDPMIFYIPEGVTSFKVYDDGGKDANYGANSFGILQLNAPKGSILRVTGSVDATESVVWAFGYNSDFYSEPPYWGNGTEQNINFMSKEDGILGIYFNTNTDYSSVTAAGLDLTVTVMDKKELEYSIACDATVDGGTFSCDKVKGIGGDVVTLTAVPAAGFEFVGIEFENVDTNVVIDGVVFEDNIASFAMPYSNVSVKPIFTDKSSELYVNMPTSGMNAVSFAAGVTSFKVYDDGGVNENYSNNVKSFFQLIAPNNYLINLFGTAKTEENCDTLSIYEGGIGDSKLVDAVSGSINLQDYKSLTSKILTLGFSTDYSKTDAGLDFTVNFVDNSEYSVACVESVDGGTVACDKDKAKGRETVTLTAMPAEGYILDGVEVKDADGRVVKSFAWYSHPQNTVSFKMPLSNVTVVPSFTKLTDLTINIAMTENPIWKFINIPEVVKSFKIHDCCSDNSDERLYGMWQLNVPQGYKILVSGSIVSNNGYVGLSVYDKESYSNTYGYPSPIYQVDGATDNVYFVVDGFEEPRFYFGANYSNEYASSLDLTVRLVKPESDYAAVSVELVDDRMVANIDGDYNITDAVNIPYDIKVDEVSLDRTFSTEGYATITLPFGIDSAKVSGAKQFLKFTGVVLNKETGLREVHMERAWCDLPALLADIDEMKLSDAEKAEMKTKVSNKCNSIPKKLFAYTPYVVQMKDNSLSFDGGVTLEKTPAAAETVIENWVLRGTFAKKIWESGDPEIGNAYGYVAGTGEFRKVSEKSSIGALRSYLVYEKQTPPSVPGMSNVRANFSMEFLPANMDVVIVDDDDENGNEHRTVIGKFNTHTGEFKFMMPESGTFDVKGRRVNETRSVGKGRKAKGVYYGRKK